MLKVNFFLCKDKLVKVAQLTGVVESQVIERDRVRGKVWKLKLTLYTQGNKSLVNACACHNTQTDQERERERDRMAQAKMG